MSEVRCSCSCGKAGLVVTGPVMGRVRCHCTICQIANRAAYADSMILLAKHVPLERVDHVRFKTMKDPPAIQRGFCRSCGCHVVAYGSYWRCLSLAFVPVARFPAEVPLPEPAMHVFYDFRIADVADAVPKYGNWPSNLAVLRTILRTQLGRAGRS